jgi:hypothetical protein
MSDLTKQDFKDAGYIEFPEKMKQCEVALQKVVYDPFTKQKRYFLNAFGYDLKRDGSLIFSYEVLFYRGDDIFNVNLYDSLSIAHVESFFAELYMKLNCEPNKDNN